MNYPECNINYKYILKLVEDENGKLSIVEHPINRNEIIEAEIEAIVDNPHKHTYDLYSKIINHCNGPECFNLCFPFDYSDRYKEGAVRPNHVSYFDFLAYQKKLIEEISKSANYYYTPDEKKEEYLIEKLRNYYHEEKANYADMVMRYIRCWELYNATSEIDKDNNVKMYSTDEIGWQSFTYSITEDIKVKVMTNFAYGTSSYFYLVAKYKEFVIIPYSDLVHYYYANMKDLIAYTRQFVCCRDSWYPALDFVKNFTNSFQKSPDNYIRDYVLDETKEMLSVLRLTIKKPQEILEKIKYNDAKHIRLNVIRPFNEIDKENYEMMPSEFISVFKAEKISGALEFINSFMQIQDLCPDIKSVINEIKEMNCSIMDEVIFTLSSIEENLSLLYEEKEEIETEINRLKSEIEKHDNQIKTLQEGVVDKDTIEQIKSDYKEKHQEYELMKEEINILNSKCNSIHTHIYNRTKLKERMEVCIKRIKEQHCD